MQTPPHHSRLFRRQFLLLALLVTGYSGFYLCRSNISVTLPLLRADLVKQIQNRLLNAGYLVPIFDQTTVLAASPKVHNLKFEASSRLQLHDMWIEH